MRLHQHCLEGLSELFIGCKVSVLRDEKVLELLCTRDSTVLCASEFVKRVDLTLNAVTIKTKEARKLWEVLDMSVPLMEVTVSWYLHGSELTDCTHRIRVYMHVNHTSIKLLKKHRLQSPTADFPLE